MMIILTMFLGCGGNQRSSRCLGLFYLSTLILSFCFLFIEAASSSNKNSCALKEIQEQKDLKKFIKSRKSVVVLYVRDESEYRRAANLFICEAITTLKGNVDAAFVNCDGVKGKKLCRQSKVNPTHYDLHLYIDGQLFSSNYDRLHTSKSLIYYLKNPKQEAPWSEDPTAMYVHHIESIDDLVNVFKKRSVLVMFYAPWCGHCKRLKPHYAEAAAAVSTMTMAAMDVNGDEMYGVRQQFNITGFPTLIYFVKGQPQYHYEGAHTKEALIEWAKNPKAFDSKPAEPPKETDWSESGSNIVFLTDESFDQYIASHSSVYVMFFAPWCGHCKQMKPEYEEAAKELAERKPDAVLAAVDATVHTKTAQKFNVGGFPTIKYFMNGTLAPFEVNYRSKKQIVDFMLDVKEPPPEEQNKEVAWEDEKTEVVQLNSENFATLLKKRKYSLVMFFAPWCGHCKKLKPEFSAAAVKLKESQPKALLGAVDCTKYEDLCLKYDISGYPTLKLFNYGKYVNEYNNSGRSKDAFIDFFDKLFNVKPDDSSSKQHIEL